MTVLDGFLPNELKSIAKVLSQFTPLGVPEIFLTDRDLGLTLLEPCPTFCGWINKSSTEGLTEI